MDWEAIGAIGELIGAAGVLLTLIYLAVQVRQNSIQLAESSRTAELASLDMLVASFSRQRQLMASEEASALYEQGLDSYSNLNPVDQRRFRAVIEEYIFPLVTLVERTRSKQGWLGFEGLDPIINGTIIPDLKRPGGKQYWEQRKSVFPTDFVASVDEFLNKPDS